MLLKCNNGSDDDDDDDDDGIGDDSDSEGSLLKQGRRVLADGLYALGTHDVQKEWEQ